MSAYFQSFPVIDMSIPEGFNKFNSCFRINLIPEVIEWVYIFQFMYQILIGRTYCTQRFQVNEFMSSPLKQTAGILKMSKIVLQHIYCSRSIFFITG